MKHQKVALVVFGLFMLSLGWYVAGQTHPAYAQGNTTMIPKSWGPCKGGVGALLIFEDGSGTVRLVDARNGKPGYTFERH